MEHHPEHDPGQQQHSAAQQTSTGSILREAREKLGLSVAEVAAQIKFAPRQIEALEADDYRNLPEVAFLRGFVRSYAKILRLDAEALLANLPQAKAAVPELPQAPSRVSFPGGQSEYQQNLIWMTAAALLALVVAGFSYWHYKTPLKPAKQPAQEIARESSGDVSGQPATQSAAQDSQSQDSRSQESQAQSSEMQQAPVQQAAEMPGQPEVAEKAPPAATSRTARIPSAKMLSEPLVLKPSTIEPMIPKARSAAAASSVRAAKTLAARRAAAAKAASAVPSVNTGASAVEPGVTAELLLVFGEESWTEIKDRDGKVLSSQVNPPGSELRVEGSPPFSMLIGHAASATLFYQGREVDLKPYINQYSEVAHLKLK